MTGLLAFSRHWQPFWNVDQHSRLASGTIADLGAFDCGAVSLVAAAVVLPVSVLDGATDVTAEGTRDFAVVDVSADVVVVLAAVVSNC